MESCVAVQVLLARHAREGLGDHDIPRDATAGSFVEQMTDSLLGFFDG